MMSLDGTGPVTTDTHTGNGSCVDQSAWIITQTDRRHAIL